MENTKQCPFCNGEINSEAIRCRHCKKWINEPVNKTRKFLDTLLLSWFLGIYGIHRFYTGYYAIGVIQLLTLGGCGIWSMIDFVSICLGNFKDAKDLPLEKYDRKLGLIILALNIVGYLLIILLVFLIMILAINTCGCKGT